MVKKKRKVAEDASVEKITKATVEAPKPAAVKKGKRHEELQKKNLKQKRSIKKMPSTINEPKGATNFVPPTVKTTNMPVFNPVVPPPIQKRVKYDCLSQDQNICIIPPNTPLIFYGWTGVICLGGSVRIDGYDLQASSYSQDAMLSVCAPFESGRPALIECTTIENLNIKMNRLKFRLKDVSPEFERILFDWGATTAAIILCQRRAPICVELFKQIHENKLYCTQNQWHPEDFDMWPSPAWHIYRRITADAIENTLLNIELRRGEEGEKLTLLPYGSKDSGKSTFCRYLINRLLKSELPVYFLDIDIGQSEFTPPGCMSLWQVKKPLLDLPWCHQQANFDYAYFYGDISPADNIDHYKKLFSLLLNHYKEISPPGSVLIINSLGWVEGAGLEALQYIVDCSEPQYIFQLAGNNSKIPKLQVAPTIIQQLIYRDYPLREKNGIWKKSCYPLKPYALREMRLVGYFSKLLSKPVVHTLNQAKMCRVDFSDALFAVPEDLSAVEDAYFLSTMNLQVIALCSTEEELPTRRIMDQEFLPKISILGYNSPSFRCYGYGIINAIDLNKRQIILITPISEENLRKTTVMIRGKGLSVPAILARTSNGAPTMYTTGRTNERGGSIDSDLFASLRVDRQDRFRRQFFPNAD